jgi:imidazole glycerol phosphate synthase glutamine amidotransferase subunit
MITIIDYGAGNLRSVCNALERLGHDYHIATQPTQLVGADRVLLPGVGHFGQMMQALDDLSLRAPLIDAASAGVAVFGICLGMQVLYEASEEAPGTPGLGLLPGEVKRFANVARIPHMGWNDVAFADGSSDSFYFANSFYASVDRFTTGVAAYGLEFTAQVEKGSVSGVQFHPEKSGEPGLRLLDRWCRGC